LRRYYARKCSRLRGNRGRFRFLGRHHAFGAGRRYQLSAGPGLMPFDIEFIRQQWPQPVSYFETIDSTMLEAARLAEAVCEPGTVVIADEQTAGQGRHGRRWHSEPNLGLYVSIVLRPELPAEAMPVLTLALGLAVAEAVGEVTGLTCDLRWPNDVML